MSEPVPYNPDIDEPDAESVVISIEKPGVPVDPPNAPVTLYGTIVTTRQHTQRPIVPTWMRNKQQRAQLARWAARYSLNIALYHLIWSPKYAAKMAFWAPVGVFRIIVKQIAWWWLLEQFSLRQDAASNNDALTWMRLHDKARDVRRFRGTILGLELVALAVAVLVLRSSLVPWWAPWLAVGVAVPLLARVGRPADHPITDRVSSGPRYRKLTAELVRRAIASCQVPAINQALAKDPNALVFPQEIGRDGPGYLAVVDLPLGVEASDVVKQRGRLASGLRLPLDQVWPEAARGHTGRLALWVGDEPASQMVQPAWPLLSRRAQVDIFHTFPFATDARLNTVTGALMERNWLIGAMPGAGKTFSLRLPLLAAALDPRVELRGYELKGSGDLDALEAVCTEYGSGADDDTTEAALGMLRFLYRECLRRGPIIKKMAKAGKAPENKVTPELASVKGLGLHPLVAFIDECQNLFSHKEHGQEAGELAEKVIKLGRALGIILLLATQRPDAKSLPKGISDNAGVRFCLRVMGQEANDMVLGTSMYKNGIRATQFGDDDKGWGWLIGLGKPTACRGFEVAGPAALRVVERALELRAAAGIVHEREDQAERIPAYNLLDDVRAVWPGDNPDALWSELIVERLTLLRPDVYGGWDAKTFGAAMKAAGVATASVHRKIDGRGATRWGVRLDQLEAAQGRPAPIAPPIAQLADSAADSDPDSGRKRL